MKRFSAFGNALRVFVFIMEAAKFWLYIPEERRYSGFSVKRIHHRDTEFAELGEFIIKSSPLCARSLS